MVAAASGRPVGTAAIEDSPTGGDPVRPAAAEGDPCVGVETLPAREPLPASGYNWLSDRRWVSVVDRELDDSSGEARPRRRRPNVEGVAEAEARGFRPTS
jgi:hypothetical protein